MSLMEDSMSKSATPKETRCAVQRDAAEAKLAEADEAVRIQREEIERLHSGAALKEAYDLLDATEARVAALEAAVRWALGEGDSDFGDHTAHGAPRYWWRKELHERAFGKSAAKPSKSEAAEAKLKKAYNALKVKLKEEEESSKELAAKCLEFEGQVRVVYGDFERAKAKLEKAEEENERLVKNCNAVANAHNDLEDEIHTSVAALIGMLGPIDTLTLRNTDARERIGHARVHLDAWARRSAAKPSPRGEEGKK